MPSHEHSMAATMSVLDGPQWRALLEARWQAQLLLRRAVAARRKLEDVEEALGRLATAPVRR